MKKTLAAVLFLTLVGAAAGATVALNTSNRCTAEALRVWYPEQVHAREPAPESAGAMAQWFLAGCRFGAGLR